MPSVLKWTNRTINVVEWTDIPKFTTLDDIVTPLRLLEWFFDDVLVDMVFDYTKRYSHREKADISFETINEKIRLFVSLWLISGYFQTIKCIVRRPPIRLWKQGLIYCLIIRSCLLLGIFIFVTENNLINNASSRSSFLWLISQIGDFWSSPSTGGTNASYDSLLGNSWQ